MALTKVTSKQVTYKQGGTGSVVQGLDKVLQEWVSVLNFDVDPTGVIDSTSGIKAAIAECTTNKKMLNMGSGCYKISSGITVTCPMRFDATSYGNASAGQVFKPVWAGRKFFQG